MTIADVAALVRAEKRKKAAHRAALMARDEAIAAALADGASATELAGVVGVHRVDIYKIRDRVQARRSRG